MSSSRHSKLNHLQRILPEGLVVDASWLEERGYSSALRGRYLNSGWLVRPARGVYRRPNGILLWEQVVVSMQSLMRFPVVVGGRTALERQGFAHYLSTEGMREVHLYGEKPFPSWITQLDVDARFILHNARRLFPTGPLIDSMRDGDAQAPRDSGLAPERFPESLTRQTWGRWDWPIVMSMPERAVLELLDEVPRNETFHQADQLIEGLRTLSPHRMQSLLEACRSIKVKRLFMWFAERHGFRWLNQISLEHIDLGKGKRMLVRGGRLDGKYLITVPEEIQSGE